MNKKKVAYMLGIDLSSWNIPVNPILAKQAGVEFAIVKVINKSNKKDKLFDKHVATCKEAGIDVIAGYTYCYANTAQKAQIAANAFIMAAGKHIKVMVLDLEDACMRGLGKKLILIINIYREAARRAGMDFIIYTGASFYEPCLREWANLIADIPIWWARYPDTKDRQITDPLPNTKYLPVIPNEIVGWQYSSKGVIPGYKGYIDLNVWYRDETPDVPILETVTPEFNPYDEPDDIITLGSCGEGARWVQWYLWRFGLLLTNGVPDVNKITGYIDQESYEMIMEAQRRLGLAGKQMDGKVWTITIALFKKTL